MYATCPIICHLSFLGSPGDETGKTIGPLHDLVKWYGINYTWDANNAVGLPKDRNSHYPAWLSFVFKSPTGFFFASQHNLFHVKWPDCVKGLFWPSRLKAKKYILLHVDLQLLTTAYKDVIFMHQFRQSATNQYPVGVICRTLNTERWMLGALFAFC